MANRTGLNQPSMSRKRQRETVDSIETARLAELLDEWVWHCRIEQRSEQTCRNYRRYTNRFLRWLEQNNRKKCGSAELMAYLGSMRNEKDADSPLRPMTAVLHHGILHNFFAWMVRYGYLDISPMESVPKPRASRDQLQVFEKEQFARLLDAARKGREPKRNVAMLLLLMDTGMRVGELCGLRLCDIELKGINRCRVTGKGNKQRDVYFGATTSRAVHAYLRDHPAASEQVADGNFASKTHFLLSSTGAHRGEPMTPVGVHRVIQTLGQRAGIQGVRCSPHTLRHTFATWFIRNGGNQQALQAILGHTTPAMSQFYVNLAQADVREQHRRASPVDRMRL